MAVEVVRETHGQFGVVHQIPEHGAGRAGRAQAPDRHRSAPGGRRRTPWTRVRFGRCRSTIAGDLVASLGGFYRTWFVVGLEAGLFSALREAGAAGLTTDDLAAATGTEPRIVREWAWAARRPRAGNARGRAPTGGPGRQCRPARRGRPEFLGGQFAHAATASLDYGGLLDFVRTGRQIDGRPDAYREAIERLTVQDVSVFFQEALAALPSWSPTSSRARGSSTSIAAADAGSSRWQSVSRHDAGQRGVRAGRSNGRGVMSRAGLMTGSPSSTVR